MIPRSWKYYLGVGIAVLFLWSTPVSAQGGFTDPGEFAFRKAPRPIGAIRISGATGLPDILGVSVSVTAGRPFELELGISSLILGWTVFGKAGLALPLLNTRNAGGRGWAIDMQIMAGYRFIGTSELFGTGKESHGITATLGFDFTYWFVRHFGITAQLTAGGNFLLYSTTTDRPVFPELRLALGVAF